MRENRVSLRSLDWAYGMEALDGSWPGHHRRQRLCVQNQAERIARQFGEVNLAGRQCVKACIRAITVQQDFRSGELLLLILQRLDVQPVVDGPLAAVNPAARMTFQERRELEASRNVDALHPSPLIKAASRFWAGMSLGGDCSACQKANCSSGVSTIVRC